MAETSIRSEIKYRAVKLAVTLDIIEVPPTSPTGIVFVVYETEVMAMPKLDRQVLMAQLEDLKQAVIERGLAAEIIGRPGKPVEV